MKSSRLTRIARVSALAALVLTVLFVGFIESSWGTLWILRYAVREATGYQDAVVEAGNVSGNRFTSLEIVDLRIRSGDSVSVGIDTLRLSHRLAPLVGGRIVLRDLVLVAPSLDLSGCLGPLPVSSRTLLLERGTVRRGTVRRDECDSETGPWTLAGIEGNLHDVVIGEEDLAGRFLGLRASLTPSGMPSGYRADLALSIELKDGRLSVTTMTLDSPGSRVAGRGVLRVPRDSDQVSDIDFELTAEPVALRDLTPFIGGLNEDGLARIEVRVTGSSRVLQVQAEVDLSDHGSVRVDADFVPGDEEDVRIDGTAQARDFVATALFDVAPTGTLDGEIDVDLSGRSMDELAGRIAVDVDRVDPVSGEASAATLNALFSDGRGDLNGEIEIAGAQASFAGWSRPFASPPEVELAGDFGWARRGSSDSSSIRLGGAFSLALAGRTLAEVSGRGGASLQASMVNRTIIPEATAEIELEDGAGAWSMAGRVGGGAVAGRGEVDLRGERVIRLVSAVVENLDIAALSGDTVSSGLSGTVIGTGRVPPGMSASLDGQISLGRTWYGPLEMDSARVGVRLLEEGRIEADVWAELFGGFAELTVDGTLANGWSARVSSGRFRSIDLSVPSKSKGLATSLDGSVAGEFTSDSSGLSGQLGLTLGSSRINRLPVDTAAAQLELREGLLTYRGMLSYPSGELDIEGDGRPSDSVPSWHIAHARFTGLDISALRAEGGPPTRLSGRVEGSVRGAERSTLDGQFDMALGSSQIGERSVRSGHLAGSIEHGRIVATAEAELEGVDVDVAAALELAGDPVGYVGSGTVRITDLGRMLQSDGRAGDLAGTFDFQGEGVDPDSLRLDVRIRSTGGRIQGVPLDSVKIVGRLASGSVAFDTLGIWSRAAVARGEGVLALAVGAAAATNLSIEMTATGAEAPRAWLGLPIEGLSRATADVVVTGPSDDLRIRAEAEAEDLSFGAIQVSHLSTSGELSLDDSLRIGNLEARASADSLRWRDLLVDDVRISGTSDGEGYAVSSDVVWGEERKGRFAAWLGADERGTDVRVSEIVIDVEEESWILDREAVLRLEDGVEVSDFLLSSSTGSLGIDGFIGSAGEQSIQVDAEGLRLHSLAEVLGYSDLSGTLDGTLRVTGTASAPLVAGELSAEMAFREGAPGQLSATIRYDSLRLDVDGSIRNGPEEEIRLEGWVPVALTFTPSDSTERAWSFMERQPLSMNLTANSFGIDWFTPFLEPDVVGNLQGVLDVDVRASGTGSEPLFDGTVFLSEASALLPGTGVRLEEGSLTARLEERRVVIERSAVRSGPGTLSAAGEMTARSLTLADLDLRLQLDGFEAIRSEFLRATVDADLTLRGTNTQPRIAGEIDVLRGDVILDGLVSGSEAEMVELSEADYAMLRERFGYLPSPMEVGPSDWRAAMGFAIDVHLGQDTWIRQRAKPPLAVHLDGDLRIDKEPGEPESIVGTLTALPRGSYVEQFGRRFDLTRGSIVYNGSPRDVRVDIETVYAVPSRQNPDAPEIVITLGVQGGAEDLNLILSSDPVVENADIVSYLATGRPADQTLQATSGAGGILLEQGTSLAVDRMTGLVEAFASQNVGLDIVEVRTDGVNGVTVLAGRYISPRLYLGIKQPVSRRRGNPSVSARSRAPEIEIEYQTFRWLLLSLQGTENRIGFFLRSRYAY